MPDGQLSPPPDLLERQGPGNGGAVVVEDTGDAIVIRTPDQVVARAQAPSRRLVGGKPGASVEDFLADRAQEIGGDEIGRE